MTREQLPQARDFMNTHVQTVGPDMPLADVVTFLLKHDISNAPVIESKDGPQPVLVGFISEGDCLDFLANEMFFGSPAQPQTVRTMMKKHPVCVAADTDVLTLASIFVSHGYRHLPVVDDQRLLGIVSRRDILKALDDYYRDAVRRRDFERFPPDLHEIMSHRFLVRGR